MHKIKGMDAGQVRTRSNFFDGLKDLMMKHGVDSIESYTDRDGWTELEICFADGTMEVPGSSIDEETLDDLGVQLGKRWLALVGS